MHRTRTSRSVSAAMVSFVITVILLASLRRTSASTMTPYYQNSSASSFIVNNSSASSPLSDTGSWTENHNITTSTVLNASLATIQYPDSTPILHETNAPFPLTSCTETPAARPTSSIIVGAGGQLVFSPSTINAAVGTIISFNFLGLNHTLTQSEFSNPCQANGKFNSGFHQFNPTNISGKFVIEYEVTRPGPQWFFCAQTAEKSHCHAGMVFSLNAGCAQKQFLRNALSAAVTTTEIKSAPFYNVPTFNMVTGSFGSSLPSSTGASSFNLSATQPTPTAIVTPITNGASTNTIHALIAILACIVLIR